jgi:hypothetical protein
LRLALLLFCGLVSFPDASCRSAGGARSLTADSAGDAALTLPDSLAATAPGGVEIWVTLARKDTTLDGHSCIDRALEIRRGATRVTVPLLYTGTAPELVDDTTLRARLSSHCTPGDAYLVDLRSGRPVREHR